MKNCFFVSPIGNEGSEVRKRADKVFKYILSPVCEKCGFNPIRVDQINKADSITETIVEYLKKSDLVIADMSGHNPNAFFEIGYRAATGKPIIHIKEKGEIIPFDIASIRAFEYNLEDLDSVEEIKSRLEQTVNAFDFNISEGESYDKLIGDSMQETETAKLLPELYKIQDQISELTKEIRNKDNNTIQTVIKAVQSTAPIEDPNTTLMKTLLPELLKNPESMKTLIEISDMTKKK